MLDRGANRAFYGRDDVTAAQIIDGQVGNPRNNVLDRVLSA